MTDVHSSKVNTEGKLDYGSLHIPALLSSISLRQSSHGQPQCKSAGHCVVTCDRYNLLTFSFKMFHILGNGSTTNIPVSRRYCLIALYNWHNTNGPILHNSRLASTRQAPSNASDPESLPRFIRRQLVRNVDNGNSVLPSELFSKQRTADRPSSKTFRSKHYDPSEATPKSQMRLLQPHALSARLKKLSDNGKLNDAIVMLENAPLDAQNTQVWNTMIWETFKANRCSLAYQLFIDVCPILFTFVSCQSDSTCR